MHTSSAAYFIIVPNTTDMADFSCTYASPAYRKGHCLHGDDPRPLHKMFSTDAADWITACCRTVLAARKSLNDAEGTLPAFGNTSPPVNRFLPRFLPTGECRWIIAVWDASGEISEPPSQDAVEEMQISYTKRAGEWRYDALDEEIVHLTGFSAKDFHHFDFGSLVRKTENIEVFQEGVWRPQTLVQARQSELDDVITQFRACYEIYDRQGNIRWLQDHSETFHDEERHIIYAKGSLRDVTRRKQAETALQWQRNLTETFLNAVSAMIVIVDAHAKIQRCNTVFEQAFGYLQRELVGMPMWGFLADGDRARVQETFQNIVTTGEANTSENVWMTKDGQARRILWSNAAVTDGNGHVLQIICTGMDVTESRLAEQERQQALIERDRFFAISSTPLVIMSFDGSRRRMNKAWEKILGYPIADAEILPLSDYFPPDQLLLVGQRLQALAHGEDVYAFDTKVVHRDGTFRWLRWDAVPYLEELLVYATAQDVTEERRAALLVRTQNKILAQIAAAQSLEETLETILRDIAAQCSTPIQPFLFLLDDTGQLHLEASGDVDERLRQVFLAAEDMMAAGSCRGAICSGALNVIADVATHPDFELAHDVMRTHNIGASWSQPLFQTNGEAIGSFALLRETPGEPDAWECHLMESAAHLASLAIERHRAADRLSKSEERYRSVVTQSSDGIWVMDFDTKRILDANPAVLSLVGYTEAEIKTKMIYDIVAHDKLSIDNFINLVRENGQYSVGERMYRHKDGSLVEIEANASRITLNGREAMAVAVRDVRSRKEAERQLGHVMIGARCLLWNADVRRGTIENIYGVGFHWDLRVLNEEAAQRFLPLQVIPYPDYTQAWTKSIPLSDIVMMNRRSAKALQNNETEYSHEFRCYDRQEQMHWFREDVRLQMLDDGHWNAIGVCTDITARKSAELERERALLERESALSERDASRTDYFNLFHNIPTGIYRTTPDGQIVMANPALIRMLGFTTFEELSARNLEREGTHAAYARQEFKDRLDRDNEIRGLETAWTRHDGDVVYVRENSRVVRDADTGEILFYEGTVEDITEWKRAEDMVRWQANHDSLTELPNRFQFQQRLERVLADARRDKKKAALIFLDLDRFKQINDTMGHIEGDRLLQEVAKRLLRSLRAEDVVARMGGDEFTVLLPVEDADEALRVARKIRRILARPLSLMGHELHLSASIGISLFPDDCDDAQTMLSHADIAMYMAKEQAGDHIEVYSTVMEETGQHRLFIESGLRRGLQRDEFKLLYQPQFDMQNRPIGVEALVRWQHPEHGLITPSHFIPVAEDTGLVMPLGDWILREACRQGAFWQHSGRPIRVAVNLSARQFALRDLPARLAMILDDTGFSPTLLDLEITESALLQQGEDALRTLTSLKSLGVRLVLDDFGTGWSSLMYLRRFPLDVLKVDKFFVDGLSVGGQDGAIVRTIIELAHAFGMQAIAEGVETEAQFESLRDLGCDAVQGYLFGRPLAAQELTLVLDGERISPLFRTAPKESESRILMPSR